MPSPFVITTAAREKTIHHPLHLPLARDPLKRASPVAVVKPLPPIREEVEVSSTVASPVGKSLASSSSPAVPMTHSANASPTPFVYSSHQSRTCFALPALTSIYAPPPNEPPLSRSPSPTPLMSVRLHDCVAYSPSHQMQAYRRLRRPEASEQQHPEASEQQQPKASENCLENPRIQTSATSSLDLAM